nr:hypothetical protein [Tanacetum cinerariifolium]
MPSLDKATVQEEPHELGTSILGRVVDRTTSPALAGTAIPQSLYWVADIHQYSQKDQIEPEGVWSSQRDGLEFVLEDIGNLNDVSQDKEVKTHAELSGGVRRTTRASSHASHDISEDASSPAQEAVPALDTQPLDLDVGADKIASDANKELYKDPKVCRTAFDRFPTPAKAHRLRELSSVELYDRISVLQCQLVTHGSVLNARYDHSLQNFKSLTKQCTHQTQTIKKQSADLKQQNESTVHANEGMSRLTAELGVLRSRSISVGVERELHMDCINEEFKRLSQKVAGFIPDATEKFDRVIAAFPDTTFPFLYKTSSATASLRANTHIRHSTLSSGTFGHTSTLDHLKKKEVR